MGRVQAGWGRPIQGMSQQADRDRINGQCTLQENMVPSVLDSLYKRIGTKHLFEMPMGVGAWDDRTVIYFYDRGDEEKYFVFVEPNTTTPIIYRIDGTRCTVDVDHLALDYCTAADPAKEMTFNTIGDYTFIANGGIQVQKSNQVQPANPDNMAIVYLQFATYSRDYQIHVNGATVASYHTVGGSYTDVGAANEAAEKIKTNYVAAQLAAAFNNKPYNVEVHDNVLVITKTDGPIYTITTTDSADGEDLIAVKNRVKSTAHLPPYAPQGWVLEVQDNNGYKRNSFFLVSEGYNGSNVTWREGVEGGQHLGFNLGTMPHVLVRESIINGVPHFKLRQGEWELRAVGNDITNPFPSFVGSYVQSVGTFQNRLFLTAGESAVFSRTNEFFNFFRETVQVQSDSDPWDAFSDSEKINLIKNSLVLDGDAVFFAESGQFIVSGDKPLTPSNGVFKQMTSFPMNVIAKPAITGESIMFAYDAGNYSGIREMFTDSDKDTKQARPITEHVEKMIQGKVQQLSSSPNSNILLVRSSVERNVVYVYDWMWNGPDKVQAAWHRWVFDPNCKILHCQFVQDNLYIVVLHGGKVYLELIPLVNDDDEQGMMFPCRLDSRVDVTATWNPELGYWWFDAPRDIPANELHNWRLVMGEGCFPEERGLPVEFTKSPTPKRYIVNAELAEIDPVQSNTVRLTLGRTYLSRYVLTQPFIRDQSGNVMSIDDITIGRVSINYTESAEFTAYVNDDINHQWMYPFSGRVMGDIRNTVGFAKLRSGTFPFPVRLKSHRSRIEVQSDSHYPLKIRGFEWEGSYQQTGRRM
ncbi:putative tail tubular protein B [Aeromonas phage HJG]|nr:putative tail tubular protein B [Aeromonas phage HJG]